jgi:aspartyl protease family protein
MLFSIWNTAWCQASSLRERLEGVASEAGIAVSGLDRVGDEPARDATGDLRDRLRTLLQDYNYLLTHGDRGKIEKLVITSLKQPDRKGSASAYISTTRAGVHHQVEARIAGPDGDERTVVLLVDTGASSIVLPASMVEQLGFQPEDLLPGRSRTASGLVAVQMGNLRSVQVGDARAENVPVTFMPNGRLGVAGLLGMSFLERFRLTLDDARDEMILQPR